MTEEEFAWIREHVWPEHMRRTYAETPGPFVTCSCQWGQTSWCQHGQHDRCRRADPLADPGGYLCDRRGYALAFTETYRHPSISATGRRLTALAMWWYADRICRWQCPCECHESPAAMMRLTRAARSTTRPGPAAAEQDGPALFDLESA